MKPAPRLEIDLDKIHHNARTLVQRLARNSISVTGVTKVTLGSPAIAAALMRAGVQGLGDSRVENLETLCRAGVPAPLTLIRAPMPSQVDRVIACADTSCNTELDVIAALSAAACRAHRTHGIVLMVELGDLREGIMPDDLENVVRATLRLPNLTLEGIGCNLACRHGVSPDARNMAELSSIVESVETAFGITLETVSGGNSASLTWADGSAEAGRINNLRLGEAIFLGREPLHRKPIEGLHTDAISLVAEVIESKIKPSKPWGAIAQSAFGDCPNVVDRGPIIQTILALGRQDIDPAGLRPPCGDEILGASSDHLIVESSSAVTAGTELTFELNYSALVRAMTSPFVAKVMRAS